ncbi:hypothetical protein [Thermoproteus tenax]|uniref:hypothetical protein n=1 Tax=Thermoproteus tenax TaxID=2271 RepID=UPI000A535314|nr:hypothetical protein [Thermoproteus tenax]
MDVFSMIEEEVRRLFEGSDADILLSLIATYRSKGARGVHERLKEILSQWGIDVEDLKD